jgi:hypothetical protein
VEVYVQESQSQPDDRELTAVVLAALNVLSALYLLQSVWKQFSHIGFIMFFNQWCVLNIVFCVLTSWVSIMLFQNRKSVSIGLDAESAQIDKIRRFRTVEAFLSILIWNKSIYFMTLSNRMAPLVAIIFKILSDIVNFMIVLAILGLSFALSFYLVGINQVQFDKIEDQGDFPLYF